MDGIKSMQFTKVHRESIIWFLIIVARLEMEVDREEAIVGDFSKLAGLF